MNCLKANAVTALQERFPSYSLSLDNITLMHKGRFANALVFRYQDEHLDVVIKDYSHCAPALRHTIGRLFINREYKNLKRLRGLSGIAADSCMLNPAMLVYPYEEGQSLTELRNQNEELPVEFFTKMEALVRDMHKEGVVHLDLRNMGNVLCNPNLEPHFIDFQSAISLEHVPQRFHNILKATDLSAVYKSWSKLCAEPLEKEKKIFLENFNKVRRFWVLRGYPLGLK